jgi:adenine-specific DNA-methyltransferase
MISFPYNAKIPPKRLKYYSYVLNRNYIGNCYELANKADYIEILNSLSGTENGLIYSQYCRGGG